MSRTAHLPLDTLGIAKPNDYVLSLQLNHTGTVGSRAMLGEGGKATVKGHMQPGPHAQAAAAAGSRSGRRRVAAATHATIRCMPLCSSRMHHRTLKQLRCPPREPGQGAARRAAVPQGSCSSLSSTKPLKAFRRLQARRTVACSPPRRAPVSAMLLPAARSLKRREVFEKTIGVRGRGSRCEVRVQWPAWRAAQPCAGAAHWRRGHGSGASLGVLLTPESSLSVLLG